MLSLESTSSRMSNPWLLPRRCIFKRFFSLDEYCRKHQRDLPDVQRKSRRRSSTRTKIALTVAW